MNESEIDIETGGKRTEYLSIPGLPVEKNQEENYNEFTPIGQSPPDATSQGDSYENLHIPISAFHPESSSEEDNLFESINGAFPTIMREEYEEPIILNKWEYTNMYLKSNSPMASNCNSDLDERISVDLDNQRRASRIKRKNAYKKFTYEDIEQSLSKYYDKNEQVVTEMDVIITYLKGISLLYAHSKSTTQMKLYTIIMGSIGLSMGLAIIAPFVKDTYWGFYLLSSGNALITILIAASRYLKLEHNAVGFSVMSRQYSILETKLEFKFNNFNAINSANQSLVEYRRNETADSWEESPRNAADRFGKPDDTLQELELKLTEMREMCNVLVPDDIIRLLPLIYNTNIFRFIKRMEQYKKNLIIRFRDIKNEIHYILHKWNSSNIEESENTKKSPQYIREKTRLMYLMELKENTKNDLMLCKNTYTQINELFNKEIRYAETHQSCFGCAGWFRPDYDFSKLNPVVRDYLKLVVPN